MPLVKNVYDFDISCEPPAYPVHICLDIPLQYFDCQRESADCDSDKNGFSYLLFTNIKQITEVLHSIAKMLSSVT